MNLDLLKSKLPYLIMGALIAVIGIIILEQFPRLFSYLHYLRIPLLTGLVLLCLPFIARYHLPNKQGNWFVVTSPCALALIIVTCVWAGLGIGIAAQVMLLNIPCRYFSECSSVATNDSIWPYALAILLAMPTSYFAYQASGPVSLQMTEAQRQSGAGFGITCAFVLLGIAYYLSSHPALFDIQQSLYSALSHLPGSTKGYLVNEQLTPGHTETIWFISLAAFLPIGYNRIFSPLLENHQPPALFYGLILILTFTLLFSFLTFWLDYYGIPIVLLAAALIMTVYCFWGAENHYDLKLVSNNFINKQENGQFTHNS